MRKRAVLAGVLLLLLGAGLWRLVVLWPRTSETIDPPEPDPRLVYDGPFLNLVPAVQYVGDSRCADCHTDIAESYRRHPMGRSLTPIDQVPELDLLNAAHHLPFEEHHSRFTVERKGATVYHRQVRLDEGRALPVFGASTLGLLSSPLGSRSLLAAATLVPGLADKGLPIWETRLPVHYAIGSGNHGKSYLSDRAGTVFLTPISWYSQKQIWDLSPGFTPAIFHGRRAAPPCLYCHANHVDPVPGTLNRYREPLFPRGHAIGCERCHGPGELHVKDTTGRFQGAVVASQHTLADPYQPAANFAIVNPHHLTPALRDAVCAQCHLEGVVRVLRRGRDLNDFRPGLPLESCWSAFVPAAQEGEEKIAVTHFEEMYLSRCFQRTAGAHKLGCVSCHNPHQKPTDNQRIPWFRNACLQCHGASEPALQAGPRTKPQHRLPAFFRKDAPQAPPCRLPRSQRLLKSPQDSCMDCHMPPTKLYDIAHGAFTDHRIRRPGKAPPRAAAPPDHGDKLPLVHFQKGPLDPKDRATARDFGLALGEMSFNGSLPPQFMERALSLLDDAVTEYPADWDAWELKGMLLMARQTTDTALTAFQTVLKREPEREIALFGAAKACEQLGRDEEAIAYWHRAIAVNPWRVLYHADLARLLAKRKNLADATEPCRKWRDLEPENLEARQLWVRCLLHAEDRTEAQAELRRLQRMAPTRAREFQRWFEDLTDYQDH